MLALPLTVGIIGLRYSTDLVLAVATVEAIQEKYHVMEKIDRRCDMSEKLKVLIINGLAASRRQHVDTAARDGNCV